MYKFITIKIKESTAKKFRIFCKKLSKSQSDTLEIMLTFFKENEVSPMESIGPTIHTLESLIKKRINGMVAILKNIEKSQTLPTQTMMQLLFEGNPPKKKKILVEKKSIQNDSVLENNSPDDS